MGRADEPKVIRSMVVITPARFGNYWPNPAAKEPQYNTWSWLPKISFSVLGPMEAGSQLSVEWMLPDGSPWLTTPFDTPEFPAGAVHTFSNNYPTQESGKRAKILTGTFPFRIRLKNELAGTNKIIYSGKYTVTKFHKGNNLPAFKNQFEYVVDQDWRLPIGYLSANYQIDDKAPRLDATFWFKGDAGGDPKGYLYQEGTLIGSGDLRLGNAYNPFTITTPGMDTGDPVWQAWTFAWNAVRLYNTNPDTVTITDGWFLNEHPGKYEIKVLRGGKLTRSVKFEVGADGKIVDNGLATANNAGAVIIVPVEVLGTTDGTWNKATAAANAYYGNPLKPAAP
jgi:hypothetical protein